LNELAPDGADSPEPRVTSNATTCASKTDAGDWACEPLLPEKS
jgi:hypothetical protein